MSAPAPEVFFYGSFINRSVLAESGLVPESMQVAMLPGYDISVRPLANLHRSPMGIVYGVVFAASHAELERLYAHAETVLGGVYLPQPVNAFFADGTVRAVLTYIAPDLEAGPPDPAYVDRIVGPGRDLGFPEWYLERLQSGLPAR